MPLRAGDDGRDSFFSDPELDRGLPATNLAFWEALLEHVERDGHGRPRVALDVGCHTGGLLLAVCRRFRPAEVFGVEPIAAARAAAERALRGVAASVSLLDVTEWDRVPAGSVDLALSHEVLYLEPDVPAFMGRIRRVMAPGGAAYVVLGCHAENPLWQAWKGRVAEAGHRVFDHAPIGIMGAASSVGLLPAVQPLRRSGWVTYDPLRADFRYPDVRTMLEHHYRHKLVFRLRAPDDGASAP